MTKENGVLMADPITTLLYRDERMTPLSKAVGPERLKRHPERKVEDFIIKNSQRLQIYLGTEANVTTDMVDYEKREYQIATRCMQEIYTYYMMNFISYDLIADKAG